MPRTIEEIRTRLNPSKNTLEDIEIRLGFKEPQELPFEKRRRTIIGDKAIARDVPPPDESISAQIRKFLKSPGLPEVKVGRTIEKSFRTNEVMLEIALRTLRHPFTKEGRRGEGLKLPAETIQAFRRPSEMITAKDIGLSLIGTEGRLRKLAEEVIPKTRGGGIDILPEKIFGVSTAEIPREALKEIADFAGFIFNPKQPLVITPVLSSMFGLAKLGLIKVLHKVADKMKARRAFNTIDAFREIETEVIKQGGKPQVKLLTGKPQKLLPDLSSEAGTLRIGEEAPVFFSKLQKSIAEKMPVKATAEMVRNIAVKGAKAEEVKWSGIQDFLKDKKTVTKQEVLDFLKINEVKIEETTLSVGGGFEVRDFAVVPSAKTTKFHQYQIPGGENYKELLLRLPETVGEITELPKGFTVTKRGNIYRVSNPTGDIIAAEETKGAAIKSMLIRLNLDKRRSEALFKSPHFDEPNVLSHVRHNERVSSKGEKVLFIEEMQSDWALAGRRKGFKEVLTSQENFHDFASRQGFSGAEIAEMFRKRTSATYQAWRVQQDRIIANVGKIPEAPLLKNWYEFTLKRMLREAVNKGFDRLAWITGKQTADRYNLAKQVNQLIWTKKKNGDISIIGLKGEEVVVTKDNLKASELESWVGKEVAKKIEAGEGARSDLGRGINDVSGGALQENDLRVGGQWATNLYDGIVPQFLNKFGKKFGARVEKVDIVVGRFAKFKPQFDKYQSIPITDAMKKVALEEGFELFAGVNPFKLLPKKFQTKTQEFWLPLSTVPQSEQLKFARSKAMAAVKRAEDFATKLYSRIDKFPLELRRDIHQYLDGQIDITDLPPEVRNLATSIQQRTIAIGKALVRRGMLEEHYDIVNPVGEVVGTAKTKAKAIKLRDKEFPAIKHTLEIRHSGAFGKLKGQYVHYIYSKHIIGDDVAIDPGSLITPTGKLDLSYLKSRNPNLTHNDRIALGLVEDAAKSVPIGMGKALTDMAKFDFLDTLAKNPEWVWTPSTVKFEGQTWGIGKLVIEVQQQAKVIAENPANELAKARYDKLSNALRETTEATKNVPEDFKQIPSSPKFGNLSGAFIRTPIWNDIMPLVNSVSDRHSMGRLLNVLIAVESQAVGLFKAGKVAFNFPTWVRNTGSNFFQNNMRGRPAVLIPGDVIKAVKGMIGKEQFWREAKRHGLFESNWSVSELREVLGNLNEVNASKWTTFLEAIFKSAKYYGKIDDLAKYTIYRQMRTGGLIDFTVRPSADIAGSLLEAQKWGMDYSLASRSIKHLRRHILPFATYQYKIAPLILESVRKRPWVIGKYLMITGVGGVSIAAEYVKQKFDISDKEWKRMLEKDLPFYITRNKTFTPVPFKSSDGKWQWANTEYFLPWGTWSEVLRDISKEEWSEIANSAGISNPFLDIAIAMKSAARGKPPIDPFTRQPIYNQLDSKTTQYLKLLEWLSNRVVPSMLGRQGALGKTIDFARGQIRDEEVKDKWGRTLTATQVISRWFGVNIISISPKQTRAIKMAMIKELHNEAAKIVRDPRTSKAKKQEIKIRFRKQVEAIKKGTF